MKKLFLFLALIVTLALSAQDKTTLDIIGGYTEKGGFSIGFGSKKAWSNWGFYVVARGLNYPSNYEGGIDYGDITDTDIISEEIKTIYYGFIGGASYSIPNTGISILGGAGVSIKQEEIHTHYRYDFEFIDDEYSLVVTPGKATHEVSFEGLIDYDFLYKHPHWGVGLQVGFNSIQGYIAQAYLNLKF